MNPTANQTSADAKTVACPLASLVLLAATHHPQDAPDLLKPLGVDEREIDQYSADNAEALDTVRKTAIAGALLDRGTFASLIRVRVGVKLIETEDPRQLATLVTAAAKLPPWVFGEEEPAQKPAGSTQQNKPYLDNPDNDSDMDDMSMQEALAEAKELITQLEQPAKVKVL